MAFKVYEGRSGGDGEQRPITKWTKIGQVVEGDWVTAIPTKFGHLIVLEQSGEENVYACPNGLSACFDDKEIGGIDAMKPGTLVRITFTEEVPSKKWPNPFKRFKLEIDDSAGAVEMKDDTDDIPF